LGVEKEKNERRRKGPKGERALKKKALRKKSKIAHRARATGSGGFKNAVRAAFIENSRDPIRSRGKKSSEWARENLGLVGPPR